MATANEQQMSHADRHDLDKLARWKEGLDSADAGSEVFPVCAIFLVSPEDRASHDIFRRYRSAFEELGGGFHHLVIFGQHGVSTTQVAFLAEVGLEQASVPLLAIAPMGNVAGNVVCVELPKGDRDGERMTHKPGEPRWSVFASQRQGILRWRWMELRGQKRDSSVEARFPKRWLPFRRTWEQDSRGAQPPLITSRR